MIDNNKDNQLGDKLGQKLIGEKLPPEVKNILARLSNQEKLIKYKWPYFKAYGSVEFDFRDYKSLQQLFKAIYYRYLSI